MLNQQHMHKAPNTVIPYHRLRLVIIFLFTAALAAACQFGALKLFSSPWWYTANIIPLIVLLLVFIAPKLQYNATSYYVHEAMIECTSGFLLHRRTLIPIERIQYIQMNNGPLSRQYQLSRLVLFTTGDTVKMPYLMHDETERLLTQINERVKAVSAYV